MNVNESARIVDVVLSDQDLAPVVATAKTAVLTDEMGALVTFDGIVRNHDGGHAVQSLTYSAHPSAKEMMWEVTRSVSVEFPNVRLWVGHRTGPLAIGDLAFCVLAASAHRGDAFAACTTVTDRIKAEVPIWKEQVLVDGRSTWVGLDEKLDAPAAEN